MSDFSCFSALDDAFGLHLARCMAAISVGFAPDGMKIRMNQSVKKWIIQSDSAADIMVVLRKMRAGQRRNIQAPDCSGFPAIMFIREPGFASSDAADAVNGTQTVFIDDQPHDMSVIHVEYTYKVIFLAKDRDSAEFMAHAWMHYKNSNSRMVSGFDIGGHTLELPCTIKDRKMTMIEDLSVPEMSISALVDTVMVTGPSIRMKDRGNIPNPIRIGISFEVLP